MKPSYKIMVSSSKGREALEKPRLNGRIILK
jgi:hypothetical protein